MQDNLKTSLIGGDEAGILVRDFLILQVWSIKWHQWTKASTEIFALLPCHMYNGWINQSFVCLPTSRENCGIISVFKLYFIRQVPRYDFSQCHLLPQLQENPGYLKDFLWLLSVWSLFKDKIFYFGREKESVLI